MKSSTRHAHAPTPTGDRHTVLLRQLLAALEGARAQNKSQHAERIVLHSGLNYKGVALPVTRRNRFNIRNEHSLFIVQSNGLREMAGERHDRPVDGHVRRITLHGECGNRKAKQ